MPLIECIPNISEGKDLKSIEKIAVAIESVDGVHLLNIDSGESANRTVFTFVGEPEKVIEAAFRMFKTVVELVDMRYQKGEHPRMGAVDVCPLVPLKNITVEETLVYADMLAKRVGEELGVSIFLYAASANDQHKINLAHIRKGEYEGMVDKLRLEKWKPDYGPVVMNPRVGVTAIGARDFLIAFNVNLNTDDVAIATEIARDVRESGRIVTDANGVRKRLPGMRKGLKAIGWLIEEFQCAQVSMNITELQHTGIYEAYEACRQIAEKYGVEVTGAELVGLVPKNEMVRTGREFLNDNQAPLSERELVELAVDKMNLNSVKPFVIDERVIEYNIASRTRSQ